MKIKSLVFYNYVQEWKFEKINFFDLTLLVGISGVGKTQILNSIDTLKSISDGESFNGIEWDIDFNTIDGANYRWKGAFEKVMQKNNLTELFRIDYAFENTENKPKIIEEQIVKDGIEIVRRSSNEFIFNEGSMPKLSSTESAIYILKEEDKIAPAYNSFRKMVFRDHTEKEGEIRFHKQLDKVKDTYKTLEEIRESDLGTQLKLALVYENTPKVFQEIKEAFCDVFEQVEDIKIESFKEAGIELIFDVPVIQIKEKGVEKWIPQNRISSGMLRTLLHISEMFLLSDGTVILIDEFENSLGVNCINVLTEDLIFKNNKLQFIATSHHPYIISKIPYEYWKIVTRKGGTIKTYDAIDFDLGEDSHHDRFMNLINLPAYKDGIEA